MNLPDYEKQIFVGTIAKLAQATELVKTQIKKSRIKRLGDIEEELIQE
ncbi:MAG: hypothetical protein K2J39_07400 [Ruminococcus sp.]|nr:hypothetical protein [Ruminococcus sp.]